MLDSEDSGGGRNEPRRDVAYCAWSGHRGPHVCKVRRREERWRSTRTRIGARPSFFDIFQIRGTRRDARGRATVVLGSTVNAAGLTRESIVAVGRHGSQALHVMVAIVVVRLAHMYVDRNIYI